MRIVVVHIPTNGTKMPDVSNGIMTSTRLEDALAGVVGLLDDLAACGLDILLP